MKKKVVRRHRLTVNSFGALAYITLVIQWVLSLLVYAPLLEALIPQSEPTPTPVVASPVVSEEPSMFIFFVAAFITIAVLVLTLVVLARIPLTIARTGKKTVATGSSALTDAYLKVTHKKPTKRLRLTIQPRAAIILKLLALLLPIGFAYGTTFVDDPGIDPTLAVFLAAFLADVVVVCFVAQYSLAYALKVPLKALW